MQSALVWPNKLHAMARVRPNLSPFALMAQLPRPMHALWGCLLPTQISSRPLFLGAIPTGAAFCVRWVMLALLLIPTAQPFQWPVFPFTPTAVAFSFDQDCAIEALGASDIDIDINLNIGEASATIYTCDLTYDYVRINAEYTT